MKPVNIFKVKKDEKKHKKRKPNDASKFIDGAAVDSDGDEGDDKKVKNEYDMRSVAPEDDDEVDQAADIDMYRSMEQDLERLQLASKTDQDNAEHEAEQRGNHELFIEVDNTKNAKKRKRGN